MASPELISRILQQYGHNGAALLHLQTGYRSEAYAVQLENDELANLILYKREPDIIPKIQNANRIGDYLSF
jgi:hypothetical protein